MSTKTPEQRASERIPWDQATIDAVGLPWDGVHNTRDIARASYATAIREEVEPRDRLLQELVDYLQRDVDGWVEPRFKAMMCEEQIALLAKANEQFGITPNT